MKVPFADLKAQYRAHQASFDAAMRAVIEDTAFVGGKYVRQFEQEFAREIGVKHCIGCGNGTDAIYIVLKMLGIGAGDEVITTSISWIATSETISQTGATPVFVDLDPTGCMDVDLVEAAITPRTRAIIPVHLYGQAARMGKLLDIARRHNLIVVEDCAQAHLAESGGKQVGTLGRAATFSFYPGKNLGAYGDAGAIVTNDDELAAACRRFANHGSLTKHEHLIEGINSRLDGMQAALLSAKLPHLREWTRCRREIAAKYDRLLAGMRDVKPLPRNTEGTHVFHLYVVEVENRAALQAALTAAGIETGIHYPRALPFLPAYRRLNKNESDFPRAAHMQSRILSLPMFPEMTDAMIEYVCATIRQSAA